MGLPGMHISILALMLLLSLGSPIIYSCSENLPRDSFTAKGGHKCEKHDGKREGGGLGFKPCASLFRERKLEG